VPEAPGRTERDWLHAGGRAGLWGNLGCWSPGTPDYASACETLTRLVADAAGVAAGARVLCLACGAGGELQWLLAERAVAQVVGIERDAALVGLAQRTLPAGAWRLLHGDAAAPASAALGLAPASFDAVLCVDAAYHLRPREALLRQALQLLRPGGRLAYTDLSLVPVAGRWRRGLLQAAAALCGLSAGDLLPAAAQARRLQGLGFVDVQVQDWSEPVLGGFSRFVRQQAQRVDGRGWVSASRRPRWTARLIGPCRAAGLGYVLLSGRKPSSAAATA